MNSCGACSLAHSTCGLTAADQCTTVFTVDFTKNHNPHEIGSFSSSKFLKAILPYRLESVCVQVWVLETACSKRSLVLSIEEQVDGSGHLANFTPKETPIDP